MAANGAPDFGLRWSVHVREERERERERERLHGGGIGSHGCRDKPIEGLMEDIPKFRVGSIILDLLEQMNLNQAHFLH